MDGKSIFGTQYLDEPVDIRSGTSANLAMTACIDLACNAARSSAPVMINGENGTGKTHLAVGIHLASPVRDLPCIYLNCSTMDDLILRHRLFGTDGSEGLLVSPDAGTVILDAVDTLPSHVQKELLRLIHRRKPTGTTVVRAGRPTTAGGRRGPRLISISGGELAERAASGQFNPNLLYYLGEITLRVPSLSERREDIPPLLDAALQRANRTLGRRLRGFSSTARNFAIRYDFPGNIKELFMLVRRAAKATEREFIFVEDFGLALTSHDNSDHATADLRLLPLAELERRHIYKALLRTGWKIRAAARILGVTPPILERKIALHQLEPGER